MVFHLYVGKSSAFLKTCNENENVVKTTAGRHSKFCI